MPEEGQEIIEDQPEAEIQDPESAPDNQAAGGGDGAEGERGRTVPLKTFIETRRNAQEARAALDWYRQNVGDPKDVAAYVKWKEAQAAGQTGEPAPLDAERRKAVRDLMRQADPEAFEAIEAAKQFQAERAEREEAMLEYAEEAMPDLAKEFGLSTKPSAINRLGAHVALEIKEDPKLLRRWKLGDGTVVRAALERYVKDYLGEVRPGAPANGNLAVKRAISKLPTPPSGGSSTTAGPKPRDEKDRGLTKQADKEAFALVRAHIGAE